MGESKTTVGVTGRGDLVFAVGLIVVSVMAGYVINAFRAQPLPVRYVSKAGRLEQQVKNLAPAAVTPGTVGSPLSGGLPTPSKPGAASLRPYSVAPVPDLSLEEFIAYTKARRGLVLDARPEVFYRLGHVPYALSLPRDKFDQAYALLRGRLETDYAVPLVVYCSSPTCEDAGLVQAALRKLGFTHVAVFRGGWAEWTAARQEEEHLP